MKILSMSSRQNIVTKGNPNKLLKAQKRVLPSINLGQYKEIEGALENPLDTWLIKDMKQKFASGQIKQKAQKKVLPSINWGQYKEIEGVLENPLDTWLIKDIKQKFASGQIKLKEPKKV